MTTIRGRLGETLTAFGVHPDSADAILRDVIGADDMRSMADLWDRPVNSFRAVFQEDLEYRAMREAVKWMDQRPPEHFSRTTLANVLAEHDGLAIAPAHADEAAPEEEPAPEPTP